MPFGRWFCAVTLTGCLLSLPAHAQTAKAALKDAQGKDVGQVQLTQTPHGVLLKMSLKGAPPGERARVFHPDHREKRGIPARPCRAGAVPGV